MSLLIQQPKTARQVLFLGFFKLEFLYWLNIWLIYLVAGVEKELMVFGTLGSFQSLVDFRGVRTVVCDVKLSDFNIS